MCIASCLLLLKAFSFLDSDSFSTSTRTFYNEQQKKREKKAPQNYKRETKNQWAIRMGWCGRFGGGIESKFDVVRRIGILLLRHINRRRGQPLTHPGHPVHAIPIHLGFPFYALKTLFTGQNVRQGHIDQLSIPGQATIID